MTPLTVDCAHIRQLLPTYYDGELEEAEQLEVASHLGECRGCTEAFTSMKDALAALGSLSPQDLGRELPARVTPLLGLWSTVAATSAAVLVGLSLAWVSGDSPQRQPPPPPKELEVTSALALPQVGGMVGIEEDPFLLEGSPDPLSSPQPSPPAAEEQALPASEREPALAVAPPQAPTPAPAVQAVARADAPPPAAKPTPSSADPASPPPPAEVLEFLGRLQLSKTSLVYQELRFFFLRDPEARDRLGRRRVSSSPILRETSPAEPDELVLRPPRGQSSYTLLEGELLDGARGLRVIAESQPIAGRSRLFVKTVSWKGLERSRSRPAPLVKGQLLLPSKPRRALLEGNLPRAIAKFLEGLRDPSLLEFKRLQLETSRLEGEARELERRLRAMLQDSHGLRGVGYTVNGTPRGLEVFGSARDLSGALPKLLRALLLEALLEDPTPEEDLFGDTQSVSLREGDAATRDEHLKLLALLSECRGSNKDTRFDHGAGDDEPMAALFLSKRQLLHGVAFR